MGATGQSEPNVTRRLGIEQRTNRPGAVQAFRTQRLDGPATVVDGVIRLHRRDDIQLGEARHIARQQMLSMLDAKAAIARAVGSGRRFEHAEQLIVTFIADGMHGDVQAGRIRSLMYSRSFSGGVR